MKEKEKEIDPNKMVREMESMKMVTQKEYRRGIRKGSK
jgi:hypothetical protein